MQRITLIAFFTFVFSSCATAPNEPLPPIPSVNSLQERDGFSWRIADNLRPFSKPGFNMVQEAQEGRVFFTTHFASEQSQHLQYALLSIYLDQMSTYKVTSPRLQPHFSEEVNRYWIGARKFNQKKGDIFELIDVQKYDPLVAYTPTQRALVVVESNFEGTCVWRVIESSTGLSASRKGPCRKQAIFVDKAGLVVEVTPADDDKKHTLDIKYNERIIVAVGDSYIAGEGTEPFMDKQCFVSPYSWPYLVTAIMAFNDPQDIYTIINRGCSGARMEHVMSEHYGGPLWGTKDADFDRKKEPQFKQVKADLCNVPIDMNEGCKRTPDYLFLSIGGNDAGFGDTVKEAILKNIKLLTPRYSVDAQRARINILRDGYTEIESAIKTHFPQARVYATNYINPLRKYNGKLCSDDEARGITIKPIRQFLALLGIALETKEIELLEAAYIDPLLGVAGLGGILSTIESQNSDQWRFVKTYHSLTNGAEPDPRYATRAICEGKIRSQERRIDLLLPRLANESWFNSADDTDRTRNPTGTIHPNIFGQAYYARRILEKLCEVDEPSLCRLLLPEEKIERNN